YDREVLDGDAAIPCLKTQADARRAPVKRRKLVDGPRLARSDRSARPRTGEGDYYACVRKHRTHHDNQDKDSNQETHSQPQLLWPQLPCDRQTGSPGSLASLPKVTFKVVPPTVILSTWPMVNSNFDERFLLEYYGCAVGIRKFGVGSGSETLLPVRSDPTS